MAEDQTNTSKNPPVSRSFRESVILLIIGFMLTGVTGTLLTSYVQRSSATREMRVAAMEDDLSQTMDTFKTITTIIDKRQFRTSRLAQVFDGVAKPETKQERIADYKEVLLEWNDSLGRNTALYEVYFADGNTRSRDCESFNSIMAEFENLHRNYVQKLLDGDATKASGLRMRAKAFNSCILRFDRRMLEEIRAKREAYMRSITS